jgi:hypothetical protein
MSTLANIAFGENFCGRISQLDPQGAPKWGRMTAHQMVCHLNDSFRVGLGERQVSRAPSPVPRSWVKWIALRTPLPWAHNLPTRPEIKQGTGGTPPKDWGQDCETLRQLIRSFPSAQHSATHPIFGEMSRDDWQIWGYRHVDHHLRQFGV